MRYLLLALCSLCFVQANAQDSTDQSVIKYVKPVRSRMVSINTTPLLAQLIPFNRTNPQLSGPYNVEFHRFRGDRAFHTSFGMFIASDDNFDVADNTHFNFRIGSEKRRVINEKWTFYKGWDFYFSVGSFNLIGDNNNDSAVFGWGPRWSIGYKISEPVSISIETAMVFGLDLNLGSPDFEFIPPVALNLNFVLPRKY